MKLNNESLKPKFNSKQHYLTAIDYFTELTKQRRPKQAPSIIPRELMGQLLIYSPELFQAIAMAEIEMQEYTKHLEYVELLLDKNQLDNDKRPCLSTFSFINKTTLATILYRMAPKDSGTAEDDQKSIIKILDLNDKIAIGIQTRDVNNYDEIDKMVRYTSSVSFSRFSSCLSQVKKISNGTKNF